MKSPTCEWRAWENRKNDWADFKGREKAKRIEEEPNGQGGKRSRRKVETEVGARGSARLQQREARRGKPSALEEDHGAQERTRQTGEGGAEQEKPKPEDTRRLTRTRQDGFDERTWSMTEKNTAGMEIAATGAINERGDAHA